MQEALHRICQKHAIDAVFLFDIKMAPYLRYLPENARTYIDLDIAYSRYYLTMQSQAKGLRRVLYRLESKRMGAYEKRIINTTEGCYIASRIDRNALSKDCRESVRILPNVIDVASFTYKPPSNRKTGKIIFTGRFSYKPNRDGAIFFYEKIFSNIKKEFENATFWLVGANPSKDVKRIHDGRDVFVTGFVDDIRTHLQQAEVFACPLRLGGGTRLKILEAMAAGLPVVTTSTGCEGLNVINGRHLFIEDNPAAFAKRITAILRGEIDVVDLCKNARGFVERFHDRASLEIEGLTD
jgi:glycosyltransferase involved in cell wall biosynthesis